MDTNDGTPTKRGPGKPKGSTNKFSAKAREWAEATGELPHEFLLRVSRGELIQHPVKDPVTGLYAREWFCPKWEDRIDAAKAAAPYFAPKFATVELVQRLSDDELDAFIKDAATAAGVSFGSEGEGGEEQATRTTNRRRLQRNPDNGE